MRPIQATETGLIPFLRNIDLRSGLSMAGGVSVSIALHAANLSPGAQLAAEIARCFGVYLAAAHIFHQMTASEPLTDRASRLLEIAGLSSLTEFSTTILLNTFQE